MAKISLRIMGLEQRKWEIYTIEGLRVAAERTFTITDANYENLPIENGQINLNM